MVKELFFGLFGGLALFIFGIQLMSEGLQKTAGDRLRKVLETLTEKPILGVVLGTLVTATIQSSSATTVMVVGFVNAGLMSLRQAAGIIFGANIGTTVTAQLVAFNLMEYAPPFIGIGFAMYFFCKRRKYKYPGQVILGFGILFLGLALMAAGVKPLRGNIALRNFLISSGSNPLLGIITGAVFTSLIQSSSVTTGIIIVLSIQKLITIDSAIPLILGTNIGTCVTALLASVGTSLTARRAALAHLMFNVFGVLLFSPFLPFFIKLVTITSSALPRQVANAHTLFNVINTLLILPLLDPYIKVICRILPGEEVVIERAAKYLDLHLLSTPSLALGQVTKEILRMANLTQEMVRDSVEALVKNKEDLIKLVWQKEHVVDELDKAITIYLSTLSQKELSDEQSIRLTGLMHAINDFERVGDHATNIVELTKEKIEENIAFSSKATEELLYLSTQVKDMLGRAIEALHSDNKPLAQQVVEFDDTIDQLVKKLRNSHIVRLNQGICHPAAGVVYLEALSNLERVADHSTNVAQVVLGELQFSSGLVEKRIGPQVQAPQGIVSKSAEETLSEEELAK